MKIDLKKAVLAGVLGTVAVDIVGFGMTGTFWDIPTLLGSKLVGEAAGALAAGVAAHYTIGVVLAVIYAGLAPSLPGNSLGRALTFVTVETVVGVWLFMFPLIGAGFAGLKVGALLPVISLVRHWAFGLVLAIVFPVEDDEVEADAQQETKEVQYRSPVQRITTITRKAA